MLETLRRIREAAREVGDLEYVVLSSVQRVSISTAVGEPLERVQQFLQNLEDAGLKLSGPVWNALAVRLLVEGDVEQARQTLDTHLQRLTRPATGGEREWPISPFWIGALCVMGAYEEAHRCVTQVHPTRVPPSTESAVIADLTFVRGITAAELRVAGRPCARTARSCARARGTCTRGRGAVPTSCTWRSFSTRSRRTSPAAARRASSATRRRRSAPCARGIATTRR